METTYRRPFGLFKALMCLCVMAFVAIFALKSWPDIQARISGLTTSPGMIVVTATSGAVARPAQNGYTPPRLPASDASANTSSAPANMATSEAMANAAYATAVAASEQRQAPIPNQNNTGDTAPLTRESIAVERQSAPAYAPTSEPIAQPQVDTAFGSKAAPPVNIQETHTCLHGQVWTDSGCKNPTPVQ